MNIYEKIFSRLEELHMSQIELSRKTGIATSTISDWHKRFAIPKYDNDGELAGYNVFKGRLVIRHAKDGKLYLYDVLRIKKETSEPLE